jgi:hypothetical protein
VLPFHQAGFFLFVLGYQYFSAVDRVPDDTPEITPAAFYSLLIHLFSDLVSGKYSGFKLLKCPFILYNVSAITCV